LDHQFEEKSSNYSEFELFQTSSEEGGGHHCVIYFIAMEVGKVKFPRYLSLYYLFDPILPVEL